jgi:hypothetical protein
MRTLTVCRPSISSQQLSMHGNFDSSTTVSLCHSTTQGWTLAATGERLSTIAPSIDSHN